MISCEIELAGIKKIALWLLLNCVLRVTFILEMCLFNLASESRRLGGRNLVGARQFEKTVMLNKTWWCNVFQFSPLILRESSL